MEERGWYSPCPPWDLYHLLWRLRPSHWTEGLSMWGMREELGQSGKNPGG